MGAIYSSLIHNLSPPIGTFPLIWWSPMATPANPKGAHYEHELQAALCRGAWADSGPSTTPKGVVVSWDELLRKYRKHCQANDRECL